MTGNVEYLLDTGPLVAFLDRNEEHHEKIVAEISPLPMPLFLPEAVLAETCHLLAGNKKAVGAVFEMLWEDALRLLPAAVSEHHKIGALMMKYGPDRMDFADACLVRLCELHPRAKLLTLDNEFRYYRKNGRQAIPLALMI